MPSTSSMNIPTHPKSSSGSTPEYQRRGHANVHAHERHSDWRMRTLRPSGTCLLRHPAHHSRQICALATSQAWVAPRAAHDQQNRQRRVQPCRPIRSARMLCQQCRSQAPRNSRLKAARNPPTRLRRFGPFSHSHLRTMHSLRSISAAQSPGPGNWTQGTKWCLRKSCQ